VTEFESLAQGVQVHDSPVLSRQTVTVTGLCRIITTMRDVVMGLDERRETDGSLGMIFQVSRSKVLNI
jgi:hypothetical protein